MSEINHAENTHHDLDLHFDTSRIKEHVYTIADEPETVGLHRWFYHR